MALLLASGLHGQAPKEFEVAVIRPSVAGLNDGTSFNTFEGGRIRISNEPVKLLIRAAFQLQNAQIAGGPSWVESDRYDIEAKTGQPEKPGPGELGPMLQRLLADRFQLKFHKQMREITVGALVVEKNKLKVATADESSAMNTHGGKPVSQLVGTAVSMSALAGYVGNRLGRIVVDKTGLAEAYDFTLQWTPEEGGYGQVPSLLEALREQLGLRIETQKSSIEVLVIDSIQRPAAN